MSVTIPTKDVGEVQDKFVPQCEVVKTDEDRIADHRKIDLGRFRI